MIISNKMKNIISCQARDNHLIKREKILHSTIPFLLPLHRHQSTNYIPHYMTTSFGGAKTAIPNETNLLRVPSSFNGFKSASNSLLLSKRLHVFHSFSASTAGPTSSIRAVSTVNKFLFKCYLLF